MFDETESSVLNFVSEAANTEDGVKYLLKTTYQPLPDATLVWRTVRFVPPLNAFMGRFRCTIDSVPHFVILA